MKILNNELIKSIIKTDFFLLEHTKFKDSKSIKVTSNKNFTLLDIIELHSSLKQLIRIFQFVKKNKNSINIISLNKQYLNILKNFFTVNKNVIENYILFNDDLNIRINKINYLDLTLNFNNKIGYKKNFFACEINSQFQLFNKGTYKLLNDLNLFNRLIFMISILQNVLKFSNKSKIN